jgi:RNA polymerase sigma-70 factor, ECF subfamily
LISLDADLLDDIRQEAVEGLEELLGDEKVLEKLESILYGKPLPTASDIFGALACCKTTETAKAEETLGKLLDHQVLIQDVCLAWEAIPSSLFSDYQYQSDFYKTLVNAGIMRNLVLALGSNESIDTFLFKALSHPDVRVMQNHGDVLLDWVKPFTQTYTDPDQLLFESNSSINNQIVQNQSDTKDFPLETRIKDNSTELPEQGSQSVVRDANAEEERVHRYRGNLAIDISLATPSYGLPELVRRIIGGDADAEAELVRRYKDGIAIIIGRIVQSQSVTEDLSQETFMKVLAKIRQGDVREPERFSGFIHQIAKLMAIDYVRKMQSAIKSEEVDAAAQIRDPQPDQFEQFWRKERAEIVGQMINELKVERDREVLFRYYIAEEDKDRICADLGLTSQQLNSVIFRALKRYKELYLKRFEKLW